MLNPNFQFFPTLIFIFPHNFISRIEWSKVKLRHRLLVWLKNTFSWVCASLLWGHYEQTDQDIAAQISRSIFVCIALHISRATILLRYCHLASGGEQTLSWSSLCCRCNQNWNVKHCFETSAAPSTSRRTFTEMVKILLQSRLGSQWRSLSFSLWQSDQEEPAKL